MKTMGVLGGIGPQATMAFVSEVHHYAQKLISKNVNAGYPPMVVYYCRFPPVLLGEDSKPLSPIAPDPRFLQASRQIGELSDFLIIAANAAHVLQEHVETASGRPVLSMIEVALKEMSQRDWQRPGLLGLGRPWIYMDSLERAGQAYLVIDKDLQERLDGAILRYMEGSDTAEDAQVAHRAVASLRERGADGIILGCTEIPLLLGGTARAADLLDPGRLLARAAVEFAIGN